MYASYVNEETDMMMMNFTLFSQLQFTTLAKDTRHTLRQISAENTI